MRHAYDGEPGEIFIHVDVDSQIPAITIRVNDNGQNSFDSEGWTPPGMGEPTVGGMGLWLIAKLMDEVHYERREDSNEWRLVKGLSTGFPTASAEA